MGRIHRNRSQQRGHAIRRNVALHGEVPDKLLRRRQRNVDVAGLIKQEHRVIKDWVAGRRRADGGSLLRREARQEAKVRHARRGLHHRLDRRRRGEGFAVIRPAGRGARVDVGDVNCTGPLIGQNRVLNPSELNKSKSATHYSPSTNSRISKPGAPAPLTALPPDTHSAPAPPAPYPVPSAPLVVEPPTEPKPAPPAPKSD